MNSIIKKRPFLIGVAGGVSSGKTSVCKKILDQLTQLNIDHMKQILIINFDSFYKKLSNEEQQKALRGEHNFDHPSSFDDELAYQTIINLIQGKDTTIEIYDYKAYGFKANEIITVRKADTPDVIIVQGILVFYYPKILDLFQMKLFVDCDADTRLSRRVVRDMTDYSRDLEHILNYYVKFVKPGFEEFCLPTKKYADVIIPRGAENIVAINLIVQHIDDLLNNPQAITNSLNYNVTSNTNANSFASMLNVDTNILSIQSKSSISPISRNVSVSSDTSPNVNKRNELQSRPH
jgi:uridine kinase